MNSTNLGDMTTPTQQAQPRRSPWQRGYDLLRRLNSEFKTQREVVLSVREWDEIKAYLKLKNVPLEQYRR